MAQEQKCSRCGKSLPDPESPDPWDDPDKDAEGNPLCFTCYCDWQFDLSEAHDEWLRKQPPEKCADCGKLTPAIDLTACGGRREDGMPNGPPGTANLPSRVICLKCYERLVSGAI